MQASLACASASPKRLVASQQMPMHAASSTAGARSPAGAAQPSHERRKLPPMRRGSQAHGRYATVSTSCPSLVIRMVCSYCAASLPSAVTTVQSSFQVCAAQKAAQRGSLMKQTLVHG